MLTRRLSALVDASLLERCLYNERPPRYEYILTGMGRDFRPVILVMFAWGNRHFAPEGASVLLVEKKTQRAVDPVIVDRRSGRPLKERDFVFAAGPAASERTRRRYAMNDQKKAAAVFRISGRRAAFVASVNRIPLRHSCDRSWLACPSPNRITQLAAPSVARASGSGGRSLGRVRRGRRTARAPPPP